MIFGLMCYLICYAILIVLMGLRLNMAWAPMPNVMQAEMLHDVRRKWRENEILRSARGRSIDTTILSSGYQYLPILSRRFR